MRCAAEDGSPKIVEDELGGFGCGMTGSSTTCGTSTARKRTLGSPKESVVMKSLFALALFSLATVSCQTSSAPVPEETTPEVDSWRALHLVGYKSDAGLDQLAKQLPEMSKAGINVLILEVNYFFQFESHPKMRQGPRQISAAGARRFADACLKHGIRVIPEFRCIGHQSAGKEVSPLLALYPELDATPGAFPDNEGIYAREWNPTDPRVNQIVFALMGELLDAFQADAFHVGMEEIFLIGSEQSPSTVDKDPAQVFADAVVDYHHFLVRQRGVKMLMWADRLLDAEALELDEREGSTSGTHGAANRIPRDIILLPWHSTVRPEYPSVAHLLGLGFEVLPASWRDTEASGALVEYSVKLESTGMLGHCFTTGGGKENWAEFPPLVQGMPLLRAQ